MPKGSPGVARGPRATTGQNFLRAAGLHPRKSLHYTEAERAAAVQRIIDRAQRKREQSLGQQCQRCGSVPRVGLRCCEFPEPPKPPEPLPDWPGMTGGVKWCSICCTNMPLRLMCH